MPILPMADLYMASLNRMPVESLVVKGTDFPSTYVDSGVLVSVPRLTRAVAYKIQLDSLHKIDSNIYVAVSANQDTVLKRDTANAKAFDKAKAHIEKHKKDFWKGAGFGFITSALLAGALAIVAAIATR